MVQNLEDKLAILMTMAADDREGMPGRDVTMPPPRIRNAERAGALSPLNLRNVRVGQAENGARKKLLRVLMTNACSFNCHYCPMRRDRELPRTLLKPEEVVRIFLDARARGWADGLFLTTGIPGRPTKVMDDIIQVLDLLRGKHGYRGYIHVKIVPGADDAQVDRITAMANRVSINLETACGETLTTIAPEKKFETTLVALQRAQRRVVDARNDERAGKPADALRPGGTAGITTQFVVGASKDSAIMAKSAELYGSGGMHHIHFSAFRPIRDTPLEHAPGAPPLREHRLYQADHLVRRYRFSHDELVFDGAGNLSLEHDPKVAWAIAHPERFPVELRTASREELLRVPGIGPLAARRIVEQRRTTAIRGLADLRALGVVTKWAQGFLTIAGRRLAAERWKEQLSLWKPEEEAGARRELFEFSPGTFR